MVKSVLMDQSRVAGLGNVYIDEVLLQCGIRPGRAVNELSEDRMEDLFEIGREVLRTAIDHDADPESYPSHYITHHRDTEEN